MRAESAAAGPGRRDERRSGVLEWCVARRYVLVVWSGMVVWSGVLFASVRSDYLGFRLGRFDFGNMVQAVWSTAHGRPLEVTAITGDEASRLSFHVDPILALLAPAWLVAPTPLSFIFVRAVVVALGALPVFWLARRHLGSERGACLLALAYLAYPWLSWAGLSPHSVALSIPLFLYAVWFLENDRQWAFAPFAVLALLTNEVTGLTVVALGLWYALARGRRAAGFGIAAGSLGWVLFAVYVIVPSFAGAPSPYYGYFAAVGGSPQGVVRTAFTHPGAILSALASGRNVLYVVSLSLPLLGLFVLAPALAAVAIPQLVLNGLAGPRAMTDPTAHYSSAAIPFLIAATVVGVGRLRTSWHTAGAAVVLAACVGVSLVVGVTPESSEHGEAMGRARLLCCSRRRSRCRGVARAGGCARKRQRQGRLAPVRAAVLLQCSCRRAGDLDRPRHRGSVRDRSGLPRPRAATGSGPVVRTADRRGSLVGQGI